MVVTKDFPRIAIHPVPDPSTDPSADSIAPPGVPAGAGSSGSPMAGAPPKPGGIAPPGGPAAQNIPPLGENAAARQGLSLVVGVMHKLLQGFSPFDDEFKDIAHSIKILSKHARPDPDAQKTGKMPQMAPGGVGPPGMPPGAMPPMAGGAQGAMMPRGPVPMGAGGPMQ